MLVKHNYIAYSSIAVQSSNSLKKFHRLFRTFGDQDEGPQGPGVKSGTVLAIRGPLRPMDDMTVPRVELQQQKHQNL